MPNYVRLRTLTTEETEEIRRLTASRKAPVRLVQRASLIALMLDDPTIPASRAALEVGFKQAGSGMDWVRRFNEEGVAGLADKPRPGRPRTHDERVRSRLISLALQKPESVGYPFALWTLERLQTAFKEREGLHLSDSTIWTWLDEEGLKWKRQQSWFQDPEKHDPQFVEKRGPSSRLT